MGTLGLRTFILSLTWIRMVKAHSEYLGPARLCGNDYVTPGRCFTFFSQNLNWEAADQFCYDNLPIPGSLAKIEDPESQSLAESEALANNWDRIWINGWLRHQLWFWQESHPTNLAYQGCWNDDENNPDLPILLQTMATTTPSQCRQMCADMFPNDPEFHVTGIQTDSAGNIQCRCSESWKKKYTKSYNSDCAKPCSYVPSGVTGEGSGANIDNFCGGYGHQLIYYGIGSEFQAFAPTLYSVEHCVVMNPAYGYNWTVHDCHDPQPFICYHEYTDQSSCESRRYYKWANGICITVHTTPKSFYEAQKDCLDYGDELLRVNNIYVHEAVKEHLDGLKMYYIGLSNREWTFSTYDIVQRYYNWGEDQPSNGADQECLSLKSTDSYRWHNIDCDIPLPFICMIDIFEPTTTYSHSGTSPTSSWYDSETTEYPSSKSESTPAPAISTELLIGIAAGIGGCLVIVVIIVVIWCCCCRRKNKDRRTHHPDQLEAGNHDSHHRIRLPEPPPDNGRQGKRPGQQKPSERYSSPPGESSLPMTDNSAYIQPIAPPNGNNHPFLKEKPTADEHYMKPMRDDGVGYEELQKREYEYLDAADIEKY